MGYIFVCGKCWIKWIVFVNIKVWGLLFEDVKIEIIKWCEDRGVNVFGIFLLVYYLVRKFFIFVICVNIDVDDYEKI